VENNSPLVCRFRFDVHYHGACEKPYEWALVKIGENEAESGYKIPEEQNLNRWRGGKVPGGSHKPDGISHPMVDLDSETSSGAKLSTLSPGQRYTAGDVFAGAGGASRGIERAGVKLLFAVDHWSPAVRSLRSNFPWSQIYDMDVYDFITSDDTRRDVDILHLSPPCQFWSPAHTVPGQNDEANQAILFCCTDLIEKFRPRLFTVEQTFGILSPRFREFFHTFLNGFTTHGYSVRWKILHLSNYGVPQLRKRLIMIGSAPGERLPPFPPATHSKDGAGGLKPWTTPFSVLAPIPATFPNPLHRPHLRRRFDPPKTPWDPTRLARTITCSGGQNYHWSGERDFTLLEYAVLQGFPTWHRFEGQYVKKQIGNAFAPSVVKVLYEHLAEWLLEEDGFDPSVGRVGRAEIPEGLAPGGFVDLVDGGEDEGVVEEEVVEVGSRSVGEVRQQQPVRRAVFPRGLSLPHGAVYVDLDDVDDDVQMQEVIYTDLRRMGESIRELDRAVRNVDAWADGFAASHRNSSQHMEGVVPGGLGQGREDVRRMDRTASYVEAQAAGYSAPHGNSHEQAEGVVGLGRGCQRPLSGVMWGMNRAAREEDVVMQDVEDLSDTETLRDEEAGRRGSDEFRGTPDNPVVLSDGE
jgi:DNA (cytosine-5)-methyltransferase 1